MATYDLWYCVCEEWVTLTKTVRGIDPFSIWIRQTVTYNFVTPGKSWRNIHLFFWISVLRNQLLKSSWLLWECEWKAASIYFSIGRVIYLFKERFCAVMFGLWLDPRISGYLDFVSVEFRCYLLLGKLLLFVHKGTMQYRLNPI